MWSEGCLLSWVSDLVLQMKLFKGCQDCGIGDGAQMKKTGSLLRPVGSGSVG